MKRVFLITFFAMLSFISCGQQGNKEIADIKHKNMEKQLKISFGNVELSAILYDNPTTQDFISRLPITTELEDYANNEKIFYPKPKLSTEGAPEGYEPSKGDITYFAPWGDVAIFYKDFRYSEGLISLGKIENNGIEKLKAVGDQQVTFELVEE